MKGKRHMSISVGMKSSIVGTKKISKEKLEEVLKQHVLWLKDSKNGKCADFGEYDLEEVELSGVNLSKADFTRANLSKTKLVGANLTGAKLCHASLDGIDLTDAILDKADLESAFLCFSTALRLRAEQANFTNCTLWANDFTEAKMAKANFMYAHLGDSIFNSADLSNCEFYLADIDYAHFDQANLVHANFTGVKNFYWATFEGANMEDVIIRDTPPE